MLLLMTSLLTSWLDPLSMQLPYRHYIREHCVKRQSNYNKNSRRTNVLNVLWRHHFDATESRDVIGDVTNRMPTAPNRKESAISNSFRDILPKMLWIQDHITDVTTRAVRVYPYLPVPVLLYPYPTRTREIATRTRTGTGTGTGNPRVRVYSHSPRQNLSWLRQRSA